MHTPPPLVLGTTNAGKLRELAELLEPWDIACCSLAGLSGVVVVEETGETFAENAALKASQQARALGRWVLAELAGVRGAEDERGRGVHGPWCLREGRASGQR
ncbi:MAG: hypothetical protein EBX36_04565 [Planctomycetia bacterium]|nr:hypothetical protein [Planctomycetia bacterium]